jgi:hypothetical protein
MSEFYINPINAELENTVFYLQNVVKVLMKKFDAVLQLKGIPGPAGQDGKDGEDGEDGTNGHDGTNGTNAGEIDLTPLVKTTDILHVGPGGWGPHIHIGNDSHTWLRIGKFRFDNVGDGKLRILDMATHEHWFLNGGDATGLMPIELTNCS